ncbi:helix-turn-helix domain-containing protein [Nocardia sp. R16R-3T]
MGAIRDGMTSAEAQRVFGVSEGSIRNWRNRFAVGGVEGLESGRPGRRAGDGAKLTQSQDDALVVFVPEQLELGGLLWTLRKFAELTQRLFGVSLTEQGMGKVLRRMGSHSSARTASRSRRIRMRWPSGCRSRIPRWSRGRRPRTQWSCSANRSGCARTISRAARRAAVARHRRSRGPGSGSPSTRCRRSLRAGTCTSPCSGAGSTQSPSWSFLPGC